MVEGWWKAGARYQSMAAFVEMISAGIQPCLISLHRALLINSATALTKHGIKVAFSRYIPNICNNGYTGLAGLRCSYYFRCSQLKKVYIRIWNSVLTFGLSLLKTSHKWQNTNKLIRWTYFLSKFENGGVKTLLDSARRSVISKWAKKKFFCTW